MSVLGRLYPFAKLPGNARFLRIAAVHRYEFERQQWVDSGLPIQPDRRTAEASLTASPMASRTIAEPTIPLAFEGMSRAHGRAAAMALGQARQPRQFPPALANASV